MEFIKKNKFTMVAIVIFVLIVIAGVWVKNAFFPNVGKALYGNRLKGIEEVKIQSQKLEQVTGAIQDKEFVEKVTSDIKGRLVTFIVTIKDDVEVGTAKELTGTLKEGFEEKQLAYYDMQLMVKKNGEDARFPIIGYKHHANGEFSFTKDR